MDLAMDGRGMSFQHLGVAGAPAGSPLHGAVVIGMHTALPGSMVVILLPSMRLLTHAAMLALGLQT